MNSNISKKDRFLGCFLGGAVGDALGYPVEFVNEDYICSVYGPQGIQTLAQAGEHGAAVITDDTQMTLFVINGLLYGMTNRTDAELDDHKAVWLAHQEWLGTQGDTSRMTDPENPKMWLYREPSLHALRAPGNTCLSSIQNSEYGGTISKPVNNSKGCGAIMKAAPFGLAKSYDPETDHGDYLMGCYKYSASLSAQTHGHPLGYMSASALAVLLAAIVHYRPGQYSTLQHAIAHSFTGAGDIAHEIYAGLKTAILLAENPHVSDLEAIHQLGEGWAAEEALYIAVFCAVRYQNDFAKAIRAAVNHRGDSDSTGAICGNILGAWLGKDAVEAAFNLKDLEMRELIEEVATDFYRAVEEGVPVGDAQWDAKYRHGRKLTSEELADICESPVHILPRGNVQVTCSTLDFDRIDADVVVCPTDTKLSGSGGLDRQIHLRAGKVLDETCRQLTDQSPLSPGNVHVTAGYDLSAKWIAHAVTPAPKMENNKLSNTEQLTQVYSQCLCSLLPHLSYQLEMHKSNTLGDTISIAIPLLGTGSLGWPVEISLECAWKAIIRFVEECVKSSRQAHCKTYQIRLCTTEKHLPLIKPYLKRWSTAFFTFPALWTNKTDILWWIRLMESFDHTSSGEYLQKENVYRFAENIRMSIANELKLQTLSLSTAAEPQEGSSVSVAASGRFWLLQGLPLLCESFCERQLDPCNKYTLDDFAWPTGSYGEKWVTWHLPKDLEAAMVASWDGRSIFDALREYHHGKLAKSFLDHNKTMAQGQIPFSLLGSGHFEDYYPEPGDKHSSAQKESAEAETASVVPLRPVGLCYTELTKQALTICFDAHKGQTDKSGLPYALHPLHLAEQMTTEDEICTALLHDVVEDTHYTLADLKKAGVSETALEALRLLTHDPDVPYMDYVIAVRQNPLARKVKQADLMHNSDIHRLDQVTAHDLRRRRKYRIALAILEEDSYDTICKHCRKRIPLDDDGLYFLSVFYRKESTSGSCNVCTVLKYSLDVERANDSHYEFSPADGNKLHTALDTGYAGIKRSLPEALSEYFENHSEIAFRGLLKELSISFQTFHF